MPKKSALKLESAIIALLLVLMATVAFNQLIISDIGSTALGRGSPTGSTTGSAVKTSAQSSDVIPTGVPKIYGDELKIKYDDVSPSDPRKADSTIKLLGNYDQTISLDGELKTRYIAIASQISCEYCCGAQSIIFSNGEAACGCAHSFAMRGLAKYLLKNHAKEYTNDQILEELGKWKTLFFPSQMIEKAAALKANNIEFNYINLASNKYRGIEKGSGGSGMVGGC